MAPAPMSLQGFDQAVDLYGQPVVRSCVHKVSEETLRYWRRVRQRRAAEVVFALQRPSGRFLVHTKAFYPDGVYRLLSGGIKPGEDLIVAVAREALEETSLGVCIRRFLAIEHHHFGWEMELVSFASCVFWVVQGPGAVVNGDEREEITGFREVDLCDMERLARQLESLSGEWADWGRFRATAHRLVAEVLPDELARRAQ